ncbi:atypical/RIO/RIO1 protein kinase [Rhizoctonia solani]|uniref:Serine/threonine-protein kinase RIO2 n=1 Tax=Rhizoctonia solani TaxID=456999 RepID=A0A8H8NW34_9AGAM|nr:atypical/RIO/RIO1 protein kinase [Rhizoctonia solani]QRW19418.1 atypical/RIO/RIO1 protein kinase [Rhizoctonia solani]
MSSHVLRSKSAPTTKPLSAHFIPKNVSFSSLEANQPSRHIQGPKVESNMFDESEELYRSPIESPLTQRVEAFNLSGGFFPSQAHEYEWASSSNISHGEENPGALSHSPHSAYSSLPATPGANLIHRPLPDELDLMATETIRSEDKMGVLKLTARGLSSLLLGTSDDKPSREFTSHTEPLSEDSLYSSIRARRLEATTPQEEQAHFGELFFGPQPGLKMKLDATDLRYITNEEFRVLTAVEMGSKNHEVVPSSLVAQISGLRNGGINKLLGQLAQRNLIARVQNTKYDGYRLTYGGYDYLALRAFSKRDTIHAVGNQIGFGAARAPTKSRLDIYVASDTDGEQMVLKIHRLGRVSFRAVKEKRDYMGKRKSASWMYLSRLGAKKEWEFMKVLHENGFPIPKPIDYARHCILMELIDAYPLRQIASHPNPGSLYSSLMDVIVRFAKAGLIHGDYNEFNILIRRETGEPVVIDFPQMVSTRHTNAEWYFNRDVECIRRFFRRRFAYESAVYPRFSKTVTESESEEGFRLDVVVAASGFSGKEMKTLDEYMESRLGEDVESSEQEGSEQEGFEQENSELESDEESEPDDDGNESPNFRQVRPAAQDHVTRQERRRILDTPLSDTGEDRDLTTRLPVESLTIKDDADGNRILGATQSKTLGGSRTFVGGDGSEGDVPQVVPKKPTSVVRSLVSSTLEKERRQNSKHHNKRGTAKVGRAKGHKGKQNLRVRADSLGVWD